MNTIFIAGFATFFTTLFIIFIFWSLFWKGWALWTAAKRNSKFWFILLLIINTFGILEIAYIFIFSKKGTFKKMDQRTDKIIDSISKGATDTFDKD